MNPSGQYEHHHGWHTAQCMDRSLVTSFGGDTQVKASITEDFNVLYHNTSTSSFTNCVAAMVVVKPMLNLEQFINEGLLR